MKIRTPSSRYHKARDCAVVTIRGHDHYLGAYNSPESLEAYHRLVAESLATPHLPPGPALPAEAPLTVTELIAAYWTFVRGYYVKAGEPTSEQDTIRQALRFLRRLYGATPAREFTPKRLKAVQQAMIDHRIVRRVTVTDLATGAVRTEERVTDRGLARRYINKQLSRIKRMFAWAVAEELVPVEVHAALQRVGALQKGKTAAREKARIGPIDPAQVERVLPLVPDPTLREHYDVASYRRAIRRACLRAGIPAWHPNQLRHTSLTEIRKEYGLEASRVCGGHREIGVTQHYAEQDRDLARRVMLQAG